MNMGTYKRVLLKLSGESLGGPAGKGIDENWLAAYAEEVAEAVKNGLGQVASAFPLVHERVKGSATVGHSDRVKTAVRAKGSKTPSVRVAHTAKVNLHHPAKSCIFLATIK